MQEGERMKVLVVYDSFFGNTERIAQAIGKALASGNSVETVRVNAVGQEQLNGVGLLVVGSPTRAFRPTKAVSDFLKGIPSGGLKGVRVAAFDTRISLEDTKSSVLRFMVKIFGYAAGPIANRLEKKGGALAVQPEGFFVKDSEGPLKEGETERAAEWARAAVKEGKEQR